MASSAPPSNVSTGAVLNDRFEVGEPIGSGAMGAVFRGVDRSTGEAVAIKVLHQRLVSSREYVTRFKREALAASRFRHESAVRVLGTGDTEQGLPFIAMELVEGDSLRAILDREGPLSVGRACNIAEQLLRALGAAHQRGIVHRDMKPDNVRVIVDADGIERPKILDFGIVKFLGGDPGELEGAVKTRTGIVLGTPKYMAPEQVRGEAVDGRADIYAVGAVTYEMLSGEPPFVADDVFGFVAMHLKQEVTPLSHKVPEHDIPAGLDELVLHMLEKNPADRPADAGTLADDLHAWAVEDPNAGAKVKALHLAMGVVVAAGVATAAAAHFVVPQVDVAVGAASLGLGLGAALAARLVPRPSVGGYARRVLVAAAAVVGLGLVSLAIPASPGLFVTMAFGLVALLAYAAYLMVWSHDARWLRVAAAGVGAPLVGCLLLPVRVAPAGGANEYYMSALDFVGEPANELHAAALRSSVVGVLLVCVVFAAASLALPRPGAARI